MEPLNDLLFHPSTAITFGRNQFERVPIILQYDLATHSIQVVPAVRSRATSQFRIYDQNGVYIREGQGSASVRDTGGPGMRPQAPPSTGRNRVRTEWAGSVRRSGGRYNQQLWL